ncbi:superoxide dismutase family protein [Pseudanabaena sp. Chao 1811]|uniref:superoxide dismutase family protein n=1 Tax=Pseudanabaena sp. Chao 1811 TaxID=2963092 RepID=UPI0022F3CA30|nr:superoxide dismutase family protein [Pseudanabaena sp. Chao 1811]
MNQNNFQSRFISKFVVLLSCATVAAIATPTTAIATEQTKIPRASSRIFNIKGEQIGTATFVQTHAGVKVTLQVQKLRKGEHMVHLHENGKCDAPNFKTAGDHFNPQPSDQTGEHELHHKHEDGKHQKPAGDLPNINVQQDGTGSLTAILPALTLGTGKNSLLKQGGTAILIHAGANGKSTIPNVDYKTRIACGVIKSE